ncbi:hypothetical protein KM043_013024 [Ampulex compressa]|nr:hypothetical protein KM043_013024 [Ampulex compressa]
MSKWACCVNSQRATEQFPTTIAQPSRMRRAVATAFHVCCLQPATLPRSPAFLGLAGVELTPMHPRHGRAFVVCAVLPFHRATLPYVDPPSPPAKFLSCETACRFARMHVSLYLGPHLIHVGRD